MTETIPLMTDGPETGPTIVLAHGAGAPMTHPFMAGMAARLALQGLRVVRFNFPYMTEREKTGTKRPPNGQKVLLDTWRQVIAQLGSADNLVIGGKSMGGRMASLIADEISVSGLVCLGYPFHPPGKPEKTRTEHLENLQTPSLFCQGTRDSLGSIDDVKGYRLSENIRFWWAEDGDHSLKPRVKSGYTLDQHMDQAAHSIAEFSRPLFK